jgi:hypothetical protein
MKTKNKAKPTKKSRVKKLKSTKIVHSMLPTAYIIIRPASNELTYPHGFESYDEARKQANHSGGVVSTLKYVSWVHGAPALKEHPSVIEARRLAETEAKKQAELKKAELEAKKLAAAEKK